jgi:hypothetical protein
MLSWRCCLTLLPLAHLPVCCRPDDRQLSRTCKNDASPKWGDVMDFVMVSAGSILNVTVYDKVSGKDLRCQLYAHAAGTCRVGWCVLPA